MAHSEVPPATLEGWYVLHQLFRLDWPAVKRWERAEARATAEEFATLVEGWREVGDEGWSGTYRMVGGGADFMLLHLRPTLEALGAAERAVQRSRLGDHLRRVLDYVSVVELGLYALTAELAERLAAEAGGEPVSHEAWTEALGTALEEQRGLSYVQRRLRPTQPTAMPYVCFYPMDKRRGPGQNWYTLPLGERSEMMHEHGTVGRRYAGRISQIISGSVGLDDWEWAVTLFGTDPLDFKEVVTEMRYDRASAVYAEFGPFHVGKRMPPEEWRDVETW